MSTSVFSGTGRLVSTYVCMFKEILVLDCVLITLHNKVELGGTLNNTNNAHTSAYQFWRGKLKALRSLGTGVTTEHFR